MASDLWNIFLNIVAAFLYAGIVWLWQKRGHRPSMPPPPPHAPTPTNTPHDRRTQNRAALGQAAHQFIFYFATFALLYLSITMPALLKALLARNDILLSDARFIGNYLPAIPVGKSYLQFTFFIAAAILYWPLLVIAEVGTSLLHPLIDAFRPVTFRVWTVTKMLIMMLLCIPTAATSIWLFYEKSFQESLMFVLMAGFMAFAMGQAQGNRR